MTAVSSRSSTPPALPDEDRLVRLARRSHEIIVANQQPGGAYPASPTFSAYRGYAWFRDGAFTAEGVSRYGDVRSADLFHDWCDRVLSARRDQIEGLVATGSAPAIETMLPTRFAFDGSDGVEPWWNFQLDGYGTWLWSVVTHAGRHGLDLARWRAGIELAVDYLAAFWAMPCYDWWEEHVERTHVSTLGAVYGGLRAVLATGLLDGARHRRAEEARAGIRELVMREGVAGSPPRLSKWLGSDAVDASLAACVVPFGLVEPGDPLARGTLDAIARDLDADGGVHRFRADVFYGGGQWVLLSGLLGWNEAAGGDADAALAHLRWMAAQAGEDGSLPEQVAHHLLHPEHRQEWLDKWGTVATPLLWSHGMYLILASELGLLHHRSVR